MILAIVLISYFMIVLDNSIIFTGLPQIESGMGLSSSVGAELLHAGVWWSAAAGRADR
jgi:hypothetical protein